jgi:hypothetical protein
MTTSLPPVRSRRPLPALKIAWWAVVGVTGLFFLVMGAMKLLGLGPTAWLVGLGFPAGLLSLLGLAQVCGALLLPFPRLTWVGAVVLSLAVCGWVVGLLAFTDRPMGVLPFVLLAVLTCLAVVSRPGADAVRRARAAAEAFAERELAREKERKQAVRERGRRAVWE